MKQTSKSSCSPPVSPSVLSRFGLATAFAMVTAGSGLALTESDLQRIWDDQFGGYQTAIANYPSPIPAEQMWDQQARIQEGDTKPCDVILRRTTALLELIKTLPGAPSLTTEGAELAALRDKANSAGGKELFYQVAALRRRIALANPLLDFDDILFIRRTATKGHMCDSRFGFHWKKGEGIFVLRNAFGHEPTIDNILASPTVTNGRFQGSTLTEGAFMGPDLSFDGKEITFAWVEPGPDETSFTKERTFHIFKVNVDGTGLTQLTDGPWNEFDPCWLPNGRIAFISERRGGYGRCHGKRVVPTYTLYSMKPDGGDIICLSYHETNEWTPSVDNNGMIVYTRWDYVDRDSDIAHHIWTCYPDGRDPRAPHGNYPLPWSTIGSEWKRAVPSYTPLWQITNQYESYADIPGDLRSAESEIDGRTMRPWGEWNPRAIPGSHRYIATAGAHHRDGGWHGTFVIIDPQVRDDNAMSQLKRVTETGFPEAESIKHHRMAAAWPLSEDFYLHGGELAHSGHGIGLLDRFGNDIALVKTKNTFDPIPLKARPSPPELPTKTNQGEDAVEDAPRATISVVNIYDADMPWPEGTDIKWMRIVQVVPQSVVPSGTELVRMPLGVVPVEDDGSVYCEAPIECEIYFQALDEYGMAVQSMRSGTYVHPGEHLSCTGCHEDKWKSTPPPPGVPKALQRAPSKIMIESPEGAVPFSRRLLVDPVVERTCKPCHDRHDQSGPSLDKFSFHTTGNGKIMDVTRGGSRTIPGKFGARFTKVGQALRKKIHQDSVPAEDLRRIITWLDCNSMTYGVYTDEGRAKQDAGEVVWPLLDVDPENPLRLDTGPDPDPTAIAGELGLSRKAKRRLSGRITVHDRRIRFVTPQSGRFSLELRDVTGRRLAARDAMVAANGMVEVDAANLGRGIYVVTVRGEGNTLTRRVSVWR